MGRPAEIWVTEDGRSTCGTCSPEFRWSEDMQASMLTRMFGIAAAMPRVVHFSHFQFEDKFNNPNDLWGGMAIVRDNFTPKPAYYAYRTASSYLTGATYTGTGPQMIPGNNPNQPKEDCDDGDLDNTDACLSSCSVAACGDGFVRMGSETCDGSTCVR